MKKQWLGAGMILLGAVFFSSKAVIVKLAYRYPVDPISLLTLRFLFSLPFFLGVAIWIYQKQQPRLSSSQKWQVLIFGVAGYYLASVFDFLGLQYIPASVERLLLFAYPTFVVLISALVLKEKILRVQWLALLVTYLGIGVTFAEGLYLSDDPGFLKGTILVILCSLTYAIYLIGSGYLIPKLGTWYYTALALSAASIAILIHHLALYQWDLFDFPRQVYLLALLMAVVATVLPVFMISEGIRLVGASNAAIMGSIGPVSTIVLAAIFLGERLGYWQIAGAFLVIGGVLLITLSQQKKDG